MTSLHTTATDRQMFDKYTIMLIHPDKL